MKNVTVLRAELSKVFAGLKDGTIPVPTACELNNTAGKMIATAKVELEYAALRKEKPSIAFLET